MDTEVKAQKSVHQGRNIKVLCQMLGVKQDDLAQRLGISQPKLSRLQQDEVIGDEMLEKIARELKVPVEAIKNMTDDTTNNYFNTFYDSSTLNAIHHYCTFNPIEKVVELYERMLKTEQEKVILLREMLEKK